MKKLAILLCMCAFLSNAAIAATTSAVKTDTPVKIMPPIAYAPQKQAEMNEKREEFYTKLNLTEDQKVKARAINAKKDAQTAPLEVQKKGIKEQLKAKKAEIKQVKEDSKKEFVAILTPEQKVTYDKLKAEKCNCCQVCKDCPNGCDKNCACHKKDANGCDETCPCKKSKKCPKEGCKKDKCKKPCKVKSEKRN